MNLCLVRRPLSGTANKKHHLGLNCLDIQAGFANRRILMTPNIQVCFGQTMPPSIAVVAGCRILAVCARVRFLSLVLKGALSLLDRLAIG